MGSKFGFMFFIYVFIITTKINNQVKISWAIISYLCIDFHTFIYLVAKYFNSNQPRLFIYLPETFFLQVQVNDISLSVIIWLLLFDYLFL